MASPFPGMDPWLEHPAIWTDVHQTIITCTRRRLLKQLGENYFVAIGERVYIEAPDRSIYPDVFIAEASRPGTAREPGVAVRTADQPEILVLETVERREPFLELRAREGHRLLTVIEVLSPTNKRAGTPGRELYLREQGEVLASPANLVEIDLLRAGERTICVPEELLASRPPYRIVVSRASDRMRRELYSFTVRDRLPRVGIPVEVGQPDILLDLPEALAEVYDEGAFARRLDYRKDPVPPLRGDDVAWARERLAARPA